MQELLSSERNNKLNMSLTCLLIYLHNGVSITAGAEHGDDSTSSCSCLVGLGSGEGAFVDDGCRKVVVSLVHTDEVTGVVISVDHMVNNIHKV